MANPNFSQLPNTWFYLPEGTTPQQARSGYLLPTTVDKPPSSISLADSFQSSADKGKVALQSIDDASTRDAFNAYLAQHKALRQNDDDGKHDAAVALATGSGAANKAFARFDKVSAQNLEAEASDLANDLNDARQPLLILALLLLFVGLLSALVSRRGIAQRLQEYR